jgi:AcrR family transcriptional regulator
MHPEERRMAPRKDARQRLLDASLELFCRRGFDGVSTREIARKAGVNEVTIFRLFGTKENVLFAIMDREADIRSRIIPQWLEPTGDVVADLSRFGAFMLEGMRQKAPIMKLGMTEVSRRPQIWKRVSPAPETALELLSRYFERAAQKGLVRKVDPRMAATVFFSFFFRSMVMETFLGKDMLMNLDDRAIGDFCRLFVEGLRKG